MRNPLRVWAPAAVVLVLFALLAGLLPGWLDAQGTRLWLIRGGLLLFGIVAAILLFFYLRSRARELPPEPEVEGGDDLSLALASAQARLASVGRSAEGRIARLPLVLVLGPSGGTKTSVVTHSDLDAELLAGELMRGDMPVPTEPVNVWYANGSIILEAGGRLLDDSAAGAADLPDPAQPPGRRDGPRVQGARLALVCFLDELPARRGGIGGGLGQATACEAGRSLPGAWHSIARLRAVHEG
jgi:type VI protein secretion system component VasK